MFSLFRSKPVLDSDSTEWLWESYAWALRNFDRNLFYNDTVLVTPSKSHFPDQADDAVTLAERMLDRIKGYMGMARWPTRLVALSEEQPFPAFPRIAISGPGRGERALVEIEAGQALPVGYDPALLQRPPDVLITLLAQNLASPLAQLCPEAPPGGDENRGAATDLLAIFMGFGIFLTNNAFNYNIGGCGSSCGCGPKGVQLMGVLTEAQMAYALALFCVLKGIPNSDVLPHLKQNVRGFYKQAVKEIERKDAALQQLRAI